MIILQQRRVYRKVMGFQADRCCEALSVDVGERRSGLRTPAGAALMHPGARAVVTRAIFESNFCPHPVTPFSGGLALSICPYHKTGTS
jgi:hypothetical protein